MKTILLATTNEGKKKELFLALHSLTQPVQILTLLDILGILNDVEENGSSFQENALIKAQYYYNQVHFPVIADDSGLVVPALNGEPGILSARYSGAESTSDQNNQKLLNNMRNIQNREAYFMTSLIFMINSQQFIETEGRCYGEISTVLKGNNGFGYDPLFLLPDQQKHMAELTVQEKQEISHRGQAIQKIIPHIIHWLSLK